MSVDPLAPFEEELGHEEPVAPPSSNGDGGWKADKNGKQFIPRTSGKPGIIYRQGEETIEEAIERDARPRDQRPKRRGGKTKPQMPPPPTGIDLKELEEMLAEAFKSPAMIAAIGGDEWAASHFTDKGPYLARNLVLASEHNPWLRRKLEEMATGGDSAMKLISLVGVGGALALYVVPPAIYFLNLPVSPRARAMFDVPDRRRHAPQPTSAAPQPAPVPAAA